MSAELVLNTDEAIPGRVLVVDDEPVVAKVLERALTHGGFEVLTAQTGEEGIELLDKTRFGCLLVDKNLPGINGLEVMRHMRSRHAYCGCVLLTAYASTESAVEALRLGAADYVEKPLQDIMLLVEKVDRLIEQQRVAYERDAMRELLERLRGEVAGKKEEIDRQQTEIQMFNEILELRVREATEDLRQQLADLRSCRPDGGPSTYVASQIRRIIDFIHSLRFDKDEPMEKAIGAFNRVARRLEALTEAAAKDSES